MHKEIVIAAYNRDLSWLDQLAPDIKRTIYRKGSPVASQDEILLEINAGRCVHTFFNHLYTRYDSLADYTFFAQDYPFDHWTNIVEDINNWGPEVQAKCPLRIGGYYPYNEDFTTNTTSSLNHHIPATHFSAPGIVHHCNNDGSPDHPALGPDLDDRWRLLFHTPCPTDGYQFVPAGHFGISREHVHLRSRAFYEQITDMLVTDPISPWCVERYESYIFDPLYETHI